MDNAQSLLVLLVIISCPGLPIKPQGTCLYVLYRLDLTPPIALESAYGESSLSVTANDLHFSPTDVGIWAKVVSDLRLRPFPIEKLIEDLDWKYPP